MTEPTPPVLSCRTSLLLAIAAGAACWWAIYRAWDWFARTVLGG